MDFDLSLNDQDLTKTFPDGEDDTKTSFRTSSPDLFQGRVVLVLFSWANSKNDSNIFMIGALSVLCNWVKCLNILVVLIQKLFATVLYFYKIKLLLLKNKFVLNKVYTRICYVYLIPHKTCK